MDDYVTVSLPVSVNSSENTSASVPVARSRKPIRSYLHYSKPGKLYWWYNPGKKENAFTHTRTRAVGDATPLVTTAIGGSLIVTFFLQCIEKNNVEVLESVSTSTCQVSSPFVLPAAEGCPSNDYLCLYVPDVHKTSCPPFFSRDIHFRGECIILTVLIRPKS